MMVSNKAQVVRAANGRRRAQVVLDVPVGPSSGLSPAGEMNVLL